jgi:hypothetical protein
VNLLRRFWTRLTRRSPDVAAPRSRPDLGRWFAAAAATGKPRGLTWLGYEPAGDPLVVRDGDRLLSLVPAVARFEPVADGELADVPQAREPRTVVAVFEFRDGRWETDGRTVFNLTPAEFVARDPTRYHPLPETPP